MIHSDAPPRVTSWNGSYPRLLAKYELIESLDKGAVVELVADERDEFVVRVGFGVRRELKQKALCLVEPAFDACGVLVFPGQHGLDDDARLLLAELRGTPSSGPWDAHHRRKNPIIHVYADASPSLVAGTLTNVGRLALDARI